MSLKNNQVSKSEIVLETVQCLKPVENCPGEGISAPRYLHSLITHLDVSVNDLRVGEGEDDV